MKKTTQMLLVEARDPLRRDIRQIICHAYSEGRTLDQSATAMGIDASTLSKWIRQLDGDIQSQVVFPAVSLTADLVA